MKFYFMKRPSIKQRQKLIESDRSSNGGDGKFKLVMWSTMQAYVLQATQNLKDDWCLLMNL